MDLPHLKVRGLSLRPVTPRLGAALRGQVMNKFSKYVGLDVHQETIAVAVADTAGEGRYMGEIVNTPEAITKLVAQLKRGTGRLAFCYEAGPCGYTICRQLLELKQDCQVVAPSL